MQLLAHHPNQPGSLSVCLPKKNQYRAPDRLVEFAEKHMSWQNEVLEIGQRVQSCWNCCQTAKWLQTVEDRHHAAFCWARAVNTTCKLDDQTCIPGKGNINAETWHNKTNELHSNTQWKLQSTSAIFKVDFSLHSGSYWVRWSRVTHIPYAINLHEFLFDYYEWVSSWNGVYFFYKKNLLFV